jgi:hypothetical protein
MTDQSAQKQAIDVEWYCAQCGRPLGITSAEPARCGDLQRIAKREKFLAAVGSSVEEVDGLAQRRLCTEEEAAYIFGVSVTTMARWGQSGAISYVNLGGDIIRFRWEHIQSRTEACEKLSRADTAKKGAK